MALQKFLRGVTANLENSNVEDGAFYYTTDGNKLYLGYGQTRNLLNPTPDQDATSGNAVILNKPTKLSDFTNDIGAGGGSSGAMEYKDITVDSVTATSDYDNYTYVYNYTWSGMTATTFVYGSLPNNDYQASQGVESTSGSVNILFASQPTLPITVRVYSFDTTSSSGMTYSSYSIYSVSASTTYSQQPYEYYIADANINSNSYVDAEILNSSYSGSMAVSSVNGGIYVYFASEPSSYPVDINIYTYANVVNTSDTSSLKYFTYSVTAVTSSSAHTGYPYACAISYLGVSESTKVDVDIDSSDYNGSYAIESSTDTLTVYFTESPTLPLTVKIWYQFADTV